MKLKTSTPTITLGDPFQEDSLSRRSQIETLTRIIHDIREPFVLAIDAEFGMGKTTFIEMWKAVLCNDGYTALSFNAWENDFTDNPFLSLLGEFQKQVDHPKGRKMEDFAKKAQKVCSAVGRASLPGLIRLVTANVIKTEELASIMADAAERATEDALQRYKQDQETISAFKAALSEFVRARSPEKPVVFFIDELDRCRPLFAIEVLEHAKHIFGVEGIVFVLGVNKTQLGHSVRAVYGADLNLPGYFARLIDLTYALPAPEIAQFVSGLHRRLTTLQLVKNQTGQNIDGDEANLLSAAASLLGTHFQTSLRMIEQLYMQMLLTWKILPAKINPVLVLAFIFIRHHDRLSFDTAARGEGGVTSYVNLFKKLRDRHEGSIRSIAAAELLYLFRLYSMSEDQIAEFLSKPRDAGMGGWDLDDFRSVRRNKSRYILTAEQRRALLKSIDLSQPFLPKPSSSE